MKIHVLLYVCLICSVFTISCSGRYDEDAENVKKIREITELFQIQPLVEKINLENPETPRALPRFREMLMNDKYILFLAQDLALVWTRSGKFVGQVGRRGRGPGEFTNILSGLLHDNLVLLVDSARGIVFKYEVEDNHVIYKSEYDVSSDDLVRLGGLYYRNGYYYGVKATVLKGGYRIFKYDMDFNVVEKFMRNRDGNFYFMSDSVMLGDWLILRDGSTSDDVSKWRNSFPNSMHVFCLRKNKRSHSIHLKSRSPVFIEAEKSGRYLIIVEHKDEMNYYHVYAVDNGRKVHEFRSYGFPIPTEGEGWEYLSMERLIQGIPIADNPSRIGFLSTSEEEKYFATLYVHEYDFGLEN